MADRNVRRISRNSKDLKINQQTESPDPQDVLEEIDVEIPEEEPWRDIAVLAALHSKGLSDPEIANIWDKPSSSLIAFLLRENNIKQ